MRFGIGQPVSRKEDRRFLTGQGQYVADIELARQTYAVFVYSPHAHARIRSIDAEAAAQAPGVFAVLTAEEWAADGLGTLDPGFMAEDVGGPPGFRTEHPPLARDRVRYVGERVAVVVAATEARARDAAELVSVEYEVLPAVVRPADALRPGSALVHDGAANNTSFTMSMGNADRVEPAFARAHHVTRLSLHNNRVTAVTMEPRGCLASYDPGTLRYTLYTSTQNVHGVRQALSQQILHIPENRIRVIARDVGGGFGTGLTYDTGQYAVALAKCQELADWNGYAARLSASEAVGKHRGRAVVYYVDNTGIFNERMELRFDPSGELTILAGTLSHGQGHETSYAQMIVDWLGMAEDKIHLAQADTDEVAIGRGTYASRSMMIGGSALRAAADEVIERGKRFAADFMEVDAADIAFADGTFTIAGTDRSMPIEQVARMSFVPVGLPSALGMGLQGAGAFSSEAASFPNGCHICELEIDPGTGAVSVDRYTVVDDVGTVINPLLVKGQIQGGIAQGAGQALLEEVVYEGDSGQLLSGSLMDYSLPRADMLPAIAIDFSPVPSTTNPLGAKGAGEGGTVASTPAVMNAILEALAPLGVTDVPMPATPERIWRALRGRAGG
jgi:CO/xanthine dehydrogenase Mo-binding subunit